MVLKQFSAMVKARTMEFVRDRATLLWGMLFPIILVVGFSFAFSGDPQPLFKLGISEVELESAKAGSGAATGGATSAANGDAATGAGNTPSPQPALELTQLTQIQFVRYMDTSEASATETALGKLRRHEIDGYIDVPAATYYLNPENPKAELLGKLLAADPLLAAYQQAQVSGEAIRYIDSLITGVIGMNIMFSCLFGVGFVIVRYRKNGVLKRLKATPVSALNFVSAQTISRLIIVMIMSTVIFVGMDLVFNFRMEGSYLNLILITLLATICMISLGLLMAARLKSEEAASGLLNLIAFPMMILSGVFFSMEGAHEIVQAISQALPLTHFISAAREIMLEGAGLGAIFPQVAVLGGLSIVFTGLAAAFFKWE